MGSTEYFDFIFATGMFNLSQPKEHFLHEDNYGDDLIAWLCAGLKEAGAEISDTGQEEWGWHLTLVHAYTVYFITATGESDNDETKPNYGEWRLSIHKPRSAKDKLLGRNHLNNGDEILHIIHRLLKSQPDLMITETESSQP